MPWVVVVTSKEQERGEAWLARPMISLIGISPKRLLRLVLGFIRAVASSSRPEISSKIQKARPLYYVWRVARSVPATAYVYYLRGERRRRRRSAGDARTERPRARLPCLGIPDIRSGQHRTVSNLDALPLLRLVNLLRYPALCSGLSVLC